MNDGFNNNLNNANQNQYYNNPNNADQNQYYAPQNNMGQEQYYNNDSYYTNNNYENNYSDTSYEEKNKKSGIWWKLLLVVLVLLVIIFLLLKFCGGGSNSKDEEYSALSARICKAAETYVNNNPSILDRTEPGRSAIIKFSALSNANLIEAQIRNPYYDGGLFSKGTQPKYYSMDNSVRLTVLNDGTIGCELVDNANDVTAPELRLNGDAEITLAVGTEFEDPGYTATDDYDGDITNRVVTSGNVNFAEAGTYELTYTVQDSAGNVSSKKRIVIYEEYADIEITLGSILDTVTPQISLKGANPYCMVKGTQFIEPGAVATDNVDGNISDRIAVTNKVTGNLMGSFRIVYKVEDSSGNQAIAYRAVIVTTECPSVEEPEKVVNNRPTITLIGKNSVTINVGTEYIDLGAQAYDKEEGDLTGRIVTDTTGVNVNSAGVYKVIYRVTDSEGLTATATRTVTVKQAVAGNPVVKFTEDKKNINVNAGEGNDSLLTAPKAVNENNVPVSVSRRIEDYTTKAAISSIDWNSAGKYRVIYTAVHGNGILKQTKSIVVTIYNEMVEIGGKNAINVSLRNQNCDINEADLVNGGVTFKSSGNKTPLIYLTGHEGKACNVGTYQITVYANVDNGSTTTKNITVYVVNDSQPTVPVTGAPSKVVITKNTLTPNNPYNTNGIWAGGAVTGITLSFEATPATGTEIANFEWSSDCQNANQKISKDSDKNGTLTWTTEGKNSVCIRAVTTTGIAGPWSNPVNLYIDRTGPTVEFTHTWADNKDDWHNVSSLRVQYNAKDSQSGLDHFEYTYDDVKAKKAEDIVTYNEASGKLDVYENTEPTRSELFVFVRAVDKAGNKGEWTLNPAYVNLDTVKPNTPVLTVEGNKTSNVKVNATFTDGNSIRPSGFGKLIYTLNDGDRLTELSKTIKLPTNTTTQNVTTSVKVWAVDKAGNTSDNFATESVIVAPAANAVTGVELSNNGTAIADGGACSTEKLKIGNTINLSAKPIPSNADQTEVSWSVADATVATIDENGKVTAKAKGTTTITAKIGTVSTTCKVEVTDSSLTSLSCNNLTGKTRGYSYGLVAKYEPSDAANVELEWTITDHKPAAGSKATEVAEVFYSNQNKKMMVKMLANGSATINVKDLSSGLTATCKLSVGTGSSPDGSSGSSPGGSTGGSTEGSTGASCPGYASREEAGKVAPSKCNHGFIINEPNYCGYFTITCKAANTDVNCPASNPYASKEAAATAAKGACSDNYITSSINVSGKTCYAYKCTSSCPASNPYTSKSAAETAAKTNCSKYTTSSINVNGATCYAYKCTSIKPTSCTTGYSSAATCKSYANNVCSWGYTGCSTANSSGCYTYTCKSGPGTTTTTTKKKTTKTCTGGYATKGECTSKGTSYCGSRFNGCTGSDGCWKYTCKSTTTTTKKKTCNCTNGAQYSGGTCSGTSCRCPQGYWVSNNSCG